jgi:hypothetical protein
MHPPTGKWHSPPFFRCFVEKSFPGGAVRINFGRNIQPMETLSQILASFDIFQVILNAFPQIFNPILNAFESIYLVLLKDGRAIMATHPGLIAGLGIVLIGYLLVTGVQQVRRFVTLRVPSKK